jgi:SAM-dependent methyltransferase
VTAVVRQAITRRLPPAAKARLRALRDAARGPQAVREDDRIAAAWSPDARRAPQALEGRVVTNLLYERLNAADVAEVERRLTADQRALWSEAPAADRRWLTLALGTHHEVPAVIGKTGLTAALPPDEVHAVSRGALAAGGSCYYADLVVEGFRAAGVEASAAGRVLDFGCSSGRVVRVLAAAFPAVEWHGCDPNEAATAWAAGHIPGVEFALSPQAPPLAYEDGCFRSVFAISVWSHFGEPLALRWLDEMHRVLRPGGALLMTTHGWHSIAHYARNGLRSKQNLAEISQALCEGGFWYRPEFGEQGDFGIRNADWGTAYMSAEWLLARTRGKWRVGAFFSGAVEENQDLFVLLRS